MKETDMTKTDALDIIEESTSTNWWYGIISRGQARYLMGAPAVAGGFVATDMDTHLDWGHYAMLPTHMSPGDGAVSMGRDEFRAALIRENSYKYLGRGEEHADERGFATEARIEELLSRVDVE